MSSGWANRLVEVSDHRGAAWYKTGQIVYLQFVEICIRALATVDLYGYGRRWCGRITVSPLISAGTTMQR